MIQTHLFKVWTVLEPILKDRCILLGLDYDGTLTPIVKHPKLAQLKPGMRKALKNLSLSEEMTLCIVSGRYLSELKKLIALPGLIYIGNHGIEIEGPKIKHTHPAALEAQTLLRHMAVRLRKKLQKIPGLFVENKIYTLSIHYRQTPGQWISRAKKIFSDEVRQAEGQSKIVLTEGKKVWEVRPALRWDKGSAFLWLFGRLMAQSQKRILPIYLGDDQTDEDAFRAVKRRGMGICITPKPDPSSEATFYLRSSSEVESFLGRLCSLKGGV